MSEPIISPMYVPTWRAFDISTVTSATYQRVLGSEPIRNLFCITPDDRTIVFVTWTPYEKENETCPS